MIQFRDGPFIRPHPAIWRIVLGANLLYELALVFLLFQDLDTARFMMTLIDPNLGVPLPEKSYAEDCSLTAANIWVCPCGDYVFGGLNEVQNALDIFCVAHTLGWFGKAMILRDYWFCWVRLTCSRYYTLPPFYGCTQILSIAFELAEYSLQHQLANFAEVCFYKDHSNLILSCPHISVGGIMYVVRPLIHIVCHNSSQWILDVLICNWIGTYLGMYPNTTKIFSRWDYPFLHRDESMSILRSKSKHLAYPCPQLRLEYILSLMNGAVSDKLTDYARKLDVCSASFHHTISRRSNGGLPHLSHITSL